MNVLCSDKTGTLTEGVVRVRSAVDFRGNPAEKARLYAFLNARYESGFANPIDEAICADRPSDLAGYKKLDEVPYDFLRRRLSILVEERGRPLLVTKGAVASVLEVCSRARRPRARRWISRRRGPRSTVDTGSWVPRGFARWAWPTGRSSPARPSRRSTRRA